MNMPFTLKSAIHTYGVRYGFTIYQNYRRFLFLARLRNLRQRAARRIFPEGDAMLRESFCTQNDDSAALQALRNENTQLRSQLQSLEVKSQNTLWISKLDHIFSCGDEQLRVDNQWSVQQTEYGGWEIVTGYCSLGGCDLNAYPVRTEREGLLFGALLSLLDYKMPQNTACSSCYAEYMQQCI